MHKVFNIQYDKWKNKKTFKTIQLLSYFVGHPVCTLMHSFYLSSSQTFPS